MSIYASQPESAAITDEDFLKFKEYFYRRTGISFEKSKRYFVDKRLVERIEATGTGSFRGYFTMLRFQASGDELQQLTNIMTVNETYFLREEYQFKCLVDSILPQIVHRRTGADPIRIWCIPSSSGEEPYSVAMFLLENWPGIKEWDVEIISSDIDTSILRRARAGRYSARSVQYIPDPWLKKYFKSVGDEYQLCDDLRQAVEFTRVNLAEPADTLSACNTGVGPVGEEGVASIVNAFIEAGSQSVVSTLWELEDHATAHLMTVFYDHLGRREEKAVALRQAQLEMLNSGAPPYYWAGFVFAGNPRGSLFSAPTVNLTPRSSR
jgi:chemotaxis protein methyltransferase CheR